jgi:protease-4
MLERTYAAFVERVAAGRGVTVAQIEPLCQGRVWAGSTAAASALVEHIGGLERAVDLATERAGLKRAWRVDRVVHADPPWRTLLRALVGRVIPGVAAGGVVRALGAEGLGEVAAVVSTLVGKPAALVMLPFRVRIR